jgi:hypothetical protein
MVARGDLGMVRASCAGAFKAEEPIMLGDPDDYAFTRTVLALSLQRAMGLLRLN